MKNVKECVKKINIYLKNYKVASNRNVNKKTNKWNKEKIYKNKKYIKMYIDIYKTYICKHENIQIYKNIEAHEEKYLFENMKEYISSRK